MILDIKTLADALTQDIRNQVQTLKQKPHLTIVMVGDNSASEVYVRNKLKTCESVGIGSNLIHPEAFISQEDLQEEIRKLNHNTDITGILVQSPLPPHINPQAIFDTIDDKKDVDGFSSINIARLYSGDESWLIPGTPKGIMHIIGDYLGKKGEKIEGKNTVVIGKSTIVGKPLSMLLLHAGATVTVCHSRTKNLSEHTKNADIVISAVGKKHLVTANMVRPDSLIIDVGINVETHDAGKKLFGDCDTENIGKIADVTPVPGGVGPMTIALLLSNVLHAHTLQGKQ